VLDAVGRADLVRTSHWQITVNQRVRETANHVQLGTGCNSKQSSYFATRSLSHNINNKTNQTQAICYRGKSVCRKIKIKVSDVKTLEKIRRRLKCDKNVQRLSFIIFADGLATVAH